MGQFKPMVKMATTEPTIELKLKKGGKVEKKMQMGGLPDAAAASVPAAPARGGMMGARAPMKPSLMARRRAMRAMPAAAAPAAPVGMAGRMMKEGGESKAEHKAEMTKMAKTAQALKEHAGKPASKAHKGLKTGGVVMGQGGFKAGGIINTEGQGGEYRNTKMDTTKPDHSPAKTGGVKLGNSGGYATGGVAKANAGGYKKGGAAKKAYATGGVVNSGAPVAMPQGRKRPPGPVSINQLSGTYKKGGRVKMKEGGSLEGIGKVTDSERAAIPSDVRSQMKTREANKAYSDWEKSQTEENEAMRNAIIGAPRKLFGAVKRMLESSPPEGSVTKTEKSVTVAKKRGGTVC